MFDFLFCSCFPNCSKSIFSIEKSKPIETKKVFQIRLRNSCWEINWVNSVSMGLPPTEPLPAFLFSSRRGVESLEWTNWISYEKPHCEIDRKCRNWVFRSVFLKDIESIYRHAMVATAAPWLVLHRSMLSGSRSHTQSWIISRSWDNTFLKTFWNHQILKKCCTFVWKESMGHRVHWSVQRALLFWAAGMVVERRILKSKKPYEI